MRVVWNQKVFPAYRLPLLEALVREDRTSFVVSADWIRSVAFNSGMDLRPWVEDLADVVDIRARVAGPFVWQSGMVGMLWAPSIDVVVTVGDPHHVSTWLLLVGSRLNSRLKVVLWTHGWQKEDTGLKRLLRNGFYRLADGLLVYGERSARRGAKYGFVSRRVAVVHNSSESVGSMGFQELSPEERANALRDMQLEPDWAVVIVATRLQLSKRLDVLLHSFRELEKVGRAMNLIVVGDGPARRSLEDQARGLRSKVRFFGPEFDSARLRQLHSLADVCVIPDSAGLAVLSALGFGVPVVTNSELDAHGPEVEALVEGRNGAFFERSDATDLARVLATWLDEHRDRTAVGRACVASATSRYTSEAQARAIARALLEFTGAADRVN